MANTYTLITSNVLGSAASSVTFSSIPGTYTDLVLSVSARGSSFAQSSETINLQFNSDSGTNYSQTRIINASGTATSSFDSSVTSLPLVRSMTGNSATASTFGSAEVYIPSYTVSQNKPVGVSGTAETNDTAGFFNNGEAGLWRNTATISSIVLTPANSTNFASGSSFYLYGIKNS